MATKRIKRMTVSLNESTYEALLELQRVGNIPISAFVCEVMESAEPQIHAITAAVKAAKENPSAGMRMLGQAVGEAQKAIQDVQDVIQKDTKPRKVRKAG
jgi:hypothetical protein